MVEGTAFMQSNNLAILPQWLYMYTAEDTQEWMPLQATGDSQVAAFHDKSMSNQ